MIIALAGRRIDAPDAKAIRFPLKSVDRVRSDLKNFLIETRPVAIVCSGACGSDLIALEVAGSLGIQRSMVLPFDKSLFKNTSVTDRPGDWGKLFDKICEELTREEKIQERSYPEDDNETYRKTNIDILKRTEALANKYSSKNMMAVVVWEGKPKDKDDTTKHFMEEAIKRDFIIREIKTID